MTKKTTLKTLPGIILVISLSLALQAEGTFKGNLLFGFRVVDTSGPGADYKYREDINLRGGARLTSFNLAYAPDNGLKKYFDRLDIQVNNFGGDPFETLSASLQKYGKYTMRYDRRKSAYFYQDLTLGDGGALYDLHTLDFDRVVDSGVAKVWLGQRADLYFNFDRYTKKGRSTTTQDVERLEFEFDKPVQEESKEVAVGLNVHFNRFSLVLEQKFLNYNNENSYFLPGYSDGGENASDPTALDYYNLNQPYDLKANFSTLRFNARPFDRLFVTGSAQFSALDMDLDYSESASGINYLNRKFESDYSGSGKFDRNMQLYDINASLAITQKLSFVGAIRFHRFDQTGSLTIGADKESMDIAYETLGVDAGVQYEFSPRLALTLGYRFENRDLDNLETVTYEFNTTQNGGFGNLKWNPTRALKLTLDYEHRSYEDPFTLISPTAYDRLRITARYQFQSFSVTGSYLMNNSKSEVEADVFKVDRNQFNLRAGYHGEKLKAFAGYAYIQSKRQGDRTVTYPPFWTGPGGTFLWEIYYEGKANLIDATLSYDVDENWKLGGYVNFYDNSGSYEVKRTTFKAYLEYTFNAGYVAQVGYRHVNFEETHLGYNDYKANIVEFSFGYRWK
jgi:hypothetical protein